MSRRNFRSHHGKRQTSPRQAATQRTHTRSQYALADLVMGRNCVEELLKHSPGRLIEVFLAESGDWETSPQSSRKVSLYERVKELGVPVREVARRELDLMVQSDSHQGVVARIAPRTYLSVDDLVSMVAEEEVVRIVALDGVLDPQNFGAILRACECFGVSAVIWSKNRAAPIGPVVSKVSVGASELLSLCPVSNLHQTLEVLKESGVWSVGAMVSPQAMPLESFEFPKKCVLIMGSEGEGIQHLIEKNLDFSVYISMFGEISSLNVSQATAVMLHSFANQHRQK